QNHMRRRICAACRYGGNMLIGQGLAATTKPKTNNILPIAWTAQFLLLMSGPPKFRVRNTQELVSGSLDFALIIQIAVWLFAGLWIARDMWKRPLPLQKTIHWTAL